MSVLFLFTYLEASKTFPQLTWHEKRHPSNVRYAKKYLAGSKTFSV